MTALPEANQILGLDLGQTTGWAQFDRPTGYWRYGELALKQKAWEGCGVEFLRFHNWLENKTVDYDGTPRVALIAYEQVAGSARGPARRIIDGQTAILMAHCEHYHIPYAAVNVQTLKKWATGKGSTPGKDTPKITKDQMTASVRERWKEFAPDQRKPVKLTDNEADALLVGWWAITEVVPPTWTRGAKRDG